MNLIKPLCSMINSFFSISHVAKVLVTFPDGKRVAWIRYYGQFNPEELAEYVFSRHPTATHVKVLDII